MARLSTHVLDTSRGVPAVGMVVELRRTDPTQNPLGTAQTNSNGRIDADSLGAEHLEPGNYELVFHAARYFRAVGVSLTDPPFLGDVVLRIGIADPNGHYHVPLLLSPYGYSTYRGS